MIFMSRPTQILQIHVGVIAVLVVGFFIAVVAAYDEPSYVLEVVLVDTNTGQNITSASSLYETLFIDLAGFPANASLSLLADTVGNATSVNFTLYGSTMFSLLTNFLSKPTNAFTHIDALPQPFALGGKTSNGEYNPVAALVTPGKYGLEAVPTSNNRSWFAFYQNIEVLARSRVANYTLVDTMNGTDIATVFQYTSLTDIFNALQGVIVPFEVDTLLFPANASVSIRANTVGQVGSVEFKLFQYNSTSRSNVTLLASLSNTFPFALEGVTRRGNYNGVPALNVPGNYTLQVTAYRKRLKRGGMAGPQQLIDFVVLPRFRVVNFTLVNVNTGKDAFFNGIFVHNTISLCYYPPQTTFDIRANLGAPAGSVEFTLSYQNGTFISTHVDNQSPFSLGQPTNGSRYGQVPALKANRNRYLIRATPYSGRGKKGSKGMSLEFNFSVDKCLF